LTNVEVWVSSSGYIDAAAVRLDDASKSFSGDIVAFDQDVTVSTVPLYYIVRADVAGGATEGTFDVSLQVYTTANTTNNPQAFTNATDVVAPPSGSPIGAHRDGGEQPLAREPKLERGHRRGQLLYLSGDPFGRHHHRLSCWA
jgi:hypothetical protein